MKKAIMLIIVVAISLTALVFSIETNAYKKDFYINKYQENNIVAITDKDIGELGRITDGLILYLKGGENELLKPHFNQREVMHMEDVGDLFNLARLIKYISIMAILFSIFYFMRKNSYYFQKQFFMDCL